jgi:hypothetical protein
MIDVTLPVWSVILLSGSVIALGFLLFESHLVIRALHNRVILLENMTRRM